MNLERPVTRFTEDEYLALERVATTKHEYLDGEIIAMAGATPRHNLVANNASTALTTRLRGRCLVFQSDQRIHAKATKLYTYPDVTVVCGKPEYHPKDRLVITNPSLLVEVLSDGTEQRDRGAKAMYYRRIPSLRALLLVAQSERFVECFQRTPTGEWTISERSGDGVVQLADFEIAIPLSEMYLDVDQLPEEE